MNPETAEFSTRRSSSLLLSMYSVETDSLLPKQQSDGHLARQSEPRHRGLHAAICVEVPGDVVFQPFQPAPNRRAAQQGTFMI
jgi:hypothetical protein